MWRNYSDRAYKSDGNQADLNQAVAKVRRQNNLFFTVLAEV